MDTKQRNQISPLLMEVLQVVKFHLKKEHLNFIQGWVWVTPEKEMLVDDPDKDLLGKLLQGHSEDQMDQGIQAIDANES
jgi:hypothetical protein